MAPRPAPGLALEWSLLPAGEPVLVGFSGGADSLALLLALRDAGRDVTAAHIHHGLRAEAEQDLDWCTDLCRQLEVPLVAERVTVKRSGGPEAAARDARYAALQRLAQATGSRRIAVAHTASDQLETILLNWLRGAAVAGLGGMAPVRLLDSGLPLVRPLLQVTAEETRAWCRERGCRWREDGSNTDPRYARNRVRHELLPLLGELSGADSAKLALHTNRAARLWREESAWLDAQAEKQLQALAIQRDSDVIILPADAFRQLPPVLQRRVLRAAVRFLQVELKDIPAVRIEEVCRQVATGGRHMVWEWPGGLSAEWAPPAAGNRLRIKRIIR